MTVSFFTFIRIGQETRQHQQEQAVEDAKEEAERAKTRTDEIAVASCEARNLFRQAQHDYNAYLLYMFRQGKPAGEVDPRITTMYEYNETLNDPVSCDLNDPNFNVDTTPPPPLPPEVALVIPKTGD